jgi:hypothetical protein
MPQRHPFAQQQKTPNRSDRVRPADCFVASIVARIRITRESDRLHVHIAGRLTATDLRRLEHACGPALTTARVSIELQLERVTDIDRAAAAFVERMTQRGATVAGQVLRAGEPQPRVATATVARQRRARSRELGAGDTGASKT